MLSTRNLKAGDVLDGRYRLERRVGGGGMGDVWEGTDTILWRTVAVKILLADLVDDRGFRERFRREARAIAVMKGPGVVEVYDYGEIDHGDAAIAYLIMEFVDGQPLSRLLGLWGTLSPADTLRVVGGVAEALGVAHAAGIVHRDIKPGNILVRDNGSVVLVDFGIARVNHNLTLTTTGVVLGTVTYMSPEQAAGENLTAASDLYSLGVVAHQCLAGSPPFKADTPLGVLSAHLRKAPPPLPAEVPYEVHDIVTRALEKEPSARWSDAAAFAEACRATRAYLTSPGPQPAPVPPRTSMQPAPGPRTGTHSGAHPVAPPAVPPETETEVEDGPRRGRLWVTLVGVLAVLAAMGALAAANPWNDPSAPAILPSGETEDGADVQVQEGDAPLPAAGDDAAQGEPDTTVDAEPTDEAEDDPGESPQPSPSNGQSAPLEQTTTSPTPSQSPSPTQAVTVTVPDIVNESESAARQRVEEAGLSPTVAYEGEGEYRCGVVRQQPSGGSKVEPDSTVQLTVARAADREACRAESDVTEAPGEG